MTTLVGRVYRFRATHSLPGFPSPWCFPHEHDYTVEVVARGGTPTDALDAWWRPRTGLDGSDLNDAFVATTVEQIAATLLDEAPESVLSVTVWEDKQRWGRAER